MKQQQAISTPIGPIMLHGDSWACRACSDRAVPEENGAEDLDETGHGQRADQGQCRGGKGRQRTRRACADSQRAEQAQVDEQLADEAVQRRQPADGDRADEESQRGSRHGLGQAAEAIDLAGAGGMHHRSGAEEQERLEEGVVPDVQQGPAQAQDDPIGPPQRAADQGQAEAHHDDADVLDAVIGQQPLQVVLADGKGHAQHARDDPQPQHHVAPGQRRRRQQRRARGPARKFPS